MPGSPGEPRGLDADASKSVPFPVQEEVADGVGRVDIENSWSKRTAPKVYRRPDMTNTSGDIWAVFL